MKIINPNAAGRFQGSVEWFRIETPEDRFNLTGEPGEMLLCEATGETWNWDATTGGWVSSGFARDGGVVSSERMIDAPNLIPQNPYCFVCIPANEGVNYWGDISGRGNHLFPDRLNDSAFSAAGYITAKSGTALGATIEREALKWNPYRESLLLSFVMKRAAPAATETVLAFGAAAIVGTPRYDGVYISHRTNGKIRAVSVLNGATVPGSGDSSLAFSDATPQERLVTIAYDHRAGVWYCWRDGVLSDKWDAYKTPPGTATAFPDQDLNYNLRVGGFAGPSGVTSAVSGIRALQVYKFAQGLPSSLGDIVHRLASAPAEVVPTTCFRFPAKRRRVAIAGQSNEQGPGPANWFNRNNGWGAPLVDLVSPAGGYNSPWPLLSELAGKRGQWLDVANTAIGTTALTDMWVGRCRVWAIGMVFQTGSYAVSPINGHVYKASTGNVTIANGAITNASLPVTSAYDPSVGGDAGLTWIDLGVAGARDTHERVYQSTDAGRWDPNGLIANAVAHVSPTTFPGFDEYGFFVSIGQGDKSMGATRTVYGAAMINLASYLSSLGIHCWLGMTCYGNTAGIQDWFNTHLIPGRADALAALASDPLVHAGGDMATYLGPLPTGTATAAGTVTDSFPAMLADALHINPVAKAIGVRAWDEALQAGGW